MEFEVRPGEILAGKYRLEQELGRGGMGVVMAAVHLHLDQRVALKFLTKDAYQMAEAVERFLREARAAVQIRSEHVARVLDFGRLDSGVPYIVMEYLSGHDLKDLVQRRGPLPIREAVDYLLQATDAVAEAHTLGIVHRDLKPSNLFLTRRLDGSPLVKVLDFGISKAVRAESRAQVQITASAAVMGSPQYMSPEQIRSAKNVDARADIWALGTILHELLAGAPPYNAETLPALLAAIVTEDPEPLVKARPDVPPELEAIVRRCLEKDRERRFANVAELGKALLPFASAELEPLVARMARLQGEAPEDTRTAVNPARAGGAVKAAPAAPAAASETHRPWAKTGSPGAPWYQRALLPLGLVTLVAAGLGIFAWLVGGEAPVDFRSTEAAAPAPASFGTSSGVARGEASPATESAVAEERAPGPVGELSSATPSIAPAPPVAPRSAAAAASEAPERAAAAPATSAAFAPASAAAEATPRSAPPRPEPRSTGDARPRPARASAAGERAAASAREKTKKPASSAETDARRATERSPKRAQRVPKRTEPEARAAPPRPPAARPAPRAPQKSDALDLFDDTK